MPDLKEDRLKLADQQLALKIKLENQFINKFNVLFRQMSVDLRNLYNATGQNLDTSVYNIEILALVLSLYRKATTLFKNTLINQIRKSNVDESNEITQILATVASSDPNGQLTTTDIIDRLANDVNVAQQQFITLNAQQNASSINQTNQKDVDAAVAASIAAAMASRVPVNRSEIAKDIEQRFLTRTLGRSPTIAATNVQNASEGIKQIEMQEFNKLIRPVTGRISNINKIWLTRMDDKVRVSHRLADFQIAPVGTPFTVQGEQLMFPGDRSLGATASNIINCRCISLPIF